MAEEQKIISLVYSAKNLQKPTLDFFSSPWDGREKISPKRFRLGLYVSNVIVGNIQKVFGISFEINRIQMKTGPFNR